MRFQKVRICLAKQLLLSLAVHASLFWFVFVFQKIHFSTDFFFNSLKFYQKKKKLKRSYFQMPSLISLVIMGKTTVFVT